MEDQRNIIIAIVLMAAVWLGYTFLFPQDRQQGPGPAATVSQQATQREPSPPPTPTRPETASSAPAFSDVVAQDVEVREITVENETFRAVFSSSGARLTAFELKNYHVAPDADSPLVDFIQVGDPQQGSLRTGGSKGLHLPGNLVYALPDIAGPVVRISPGETREIAFLGRTPDGLEVRKVYTFRGDSFDFNLRTELRNAGASPVAGNLELALVKTLPSEEEKSQYTFEGPVTLTGEELQTHDVDDLEEGPKVLLDPAWSGFETKYFLGAAIPLESGARQVELHQVDGMVENVFASPLDLAPGESTAQEFLLYFGPRDLDILRGVNHRLAEAIDFGFFSPIARPLLHVLKFFYSFVGNYGVAIILLTVIIKLLFWPLTQKSYSSMKAMQKLQPEMQKIRERFKNDRERLNQEIMGLYKKHRVNPLGGCLPMLVQIPVFFALYKVLLGSIELRHAPFALWITDLSAKDPYYITPLIMGASMFVQQKMSPSTMDPTQARIFMAMPVVFTFLFLNFPSGLVIYWLVNNLLTIGQQYLINRKPA